MTHHIGDDPRKEQALLLFMRTFLHRHEWLLAFQGSKYSDRCDERLTMMDGCGEKSGYKNGIDQSKM